MLSIYDSETIDIVENLHNLLHTSRAEVVRRCIHEYKKRHLDGLYFSIEDLQEDIEKFTIRKKKIEEKIERLNKLLFETIENNKKKEEEVINDNLTSPHTQ